ncbi:MAG TPA: glycosyltransferase family 39 protein [Chryseolinea sp.]|nr:glycosyltransferase family 39 protein [Chryseolinea sp.]
MTKFTLAHWLVSMVGALCFLMVATSGLWGVIETSEARYAQISREMVESGDWIHPSLLAIKHYHKPLLTYWITAASYATFGSNAFATRFFLTIAFGIQVLLIYRIAQNLFTDELVPWFSAIVYASLPIVLISVRGLTTDAYVNTFALLTIYCWIRYCKTQQAYLLFCTALAIGLGFMTKGPVIFVLPLFGIIGIWKFLPRPTVKVVPFVLAAMLAAFISLWWFGSLILEDHRFSDYFIFHHLVDRVTHAGVFSRSEPWYYYIPIAPAVAFPWIVVLIRGYIDKTNRPEDTYKSLITRISIWWILVPFVLFSSASSKLVLYILPIFTGIALVTGYFLSLNTSRNQLLIVISLMLFLYVALILVPFVEPSATDKRFLVFPVGAIAISLYGWYAKRSARFKLSLWAVVFAGTLILYSSFYFGNNQIQVNSLRPVTTFLQQQSLAERNILVYNALLPSISFELQKNIISVFVDDQSLKRETQFETGDQWKKYLINTKEQQGRRQFDEMLHQKDVVIVKTKAAAGLKKNLEGTWQTKSFGKWTVFYN